MPDDVVDYSGARPAPSLLRDNGYVAAMRYLGNDWRCLTPEEKNGLWGAGIRIGLIGQGQVQRPLSGYNGGRDDADKYNWWAEAHGFPRHVPILYVSDVGRTEGGQPYSPTKGLSFPTSDQWGKIEDYYRGILDRTFTQGYRPAGMYGPYSLIERLRYMPLFCYWQTAGDTQYVWGNGTGGSIQNIGDAQGSRRRVSSLACLYQMYGAIIPDTDHNVVLKGDMLKKFTWHPDDENQPQTQEDEDMYKILWTAPGSRWARDVAKLPTEGPKTYAFAANGRFLSFLRNDEETETIRGIIRLEGGSTDPNLPNNREIRDVNDTALFAGYTLVPRSLMPAGMSVLEER